MKTLRTITVALCCTLLWSGLASAKQAVAVAAAANMQPVMADIQAALVKQDIEVQTTLGSSGKLTAQIAEGAPFDIFVSADQRYPEELYKKGLCEKPKVYGSGTLVLWTLVKGVQPDADLSILKNSKIKKIAVANPQVAPYGVAAVEAMKKLGVYDAIEGKIAYGESISQVNQYIDSQTAEIGFTSKSTVLAPQASGKGQWVEVKPGSYAPIDQAAAILTHGQKTNPKYAKAFFDFLFSEEGKAILKKYGYLLP